MDIPRYFERWQDKIIPTDVLPLVDNWHVPMEHLSEIIISSNILLHNATPARPNPVLYLDEVHYLTVQVLPDIQPLELSILEPVMM